MSEKGSEGEPKYEEPVLKYPIHSPEFEGTYTVLSILSETETLSKLVIEDTEYADRYYLLRYILDKDEKAEKIKGYFITLEELTKSSFSPLEMIKLWRTSTYKLSGDNGQEEFLVFFEWGEPDCIDLARLTTTQTIKFLKNMMDILDTTYRITGITHSSIFLENILLIGNQLKLGGWRPFFYSRGNGDYWKDHVARWCGKKRLDIVMVGLLWLQLAQVDLGPIIADQELGFEEFKRLVAEKVRECGKFSSHHVLLTKM
jgi:hypothetical protein